MNAALSSAGQCNQAVVYADPKVLTTREDYDAFLKTSALPVPSFSSTKESIAATGTDHEAEKQLRRPQTMFPKIRMLRLL